jgi:hypothetical protein
MTSGSDDNPIGERLSPASVPTATRISADTLLGAFRHVTNSYKHLFFRALLKEIARGRREILRTDLAAGMMEQAWWPGFHFRLHLGARDSVVSRIDATVDIDGLRRDPRAVRRALEGAVTARDPLLRCIEPDRIVVSDAWMRLLGDHLAFVQGWSDAVWVEYLEARNPGVPGLAAKFSPALARPSLADQAVLWRAVMGRRLDQVMPAHLLEAAIVGAILADEDHIDRRLRRACRCAN